MVDAVILAGGGSIDRDGGPAEGVMSKALIKIHCRYMIEYIIDSLKQAACVDRIVVVGPPSVGDTVRDRVDAVLPEGSSIMNNVSLAMKYLGCGRHAIICTCDIPLVSGEAIDDFVYTCHNKKVDIGYPIIEKALNDKKYPDAKRTYVKMKDGIYTGGNIVYINPDALNKCYDIAAKLIDNRKSPIKMGRAIGFWTLTKLCMGRLSIDSVEKRACKLFGVNARAIKTMYPEIGNDVDKPGDVEFVNKYINHGL